MQLGLRFAAFINLINHALMQSNWIDLNVIFVILIRVANLFYDANIDVIARNSWIDVNSICWYSLISF